MTGRLLIVGGGIGGVTAALALRRAGIDAALFERAPAFTEVGTGMSLWPNATRMLKSLGMLEQVLALGEPFTHFDLRRSGGQLISTVSLEGFPTPAVCIHRADLHGALRHPLPPACLEANRRLVSFSQDDGGVVARFAGGHEAAGIGLIGADGINSVVRSQLHGAAAPLYQGYRIWRGIAPETARIPRGRISESWGHGQRFGVLPMGRGRICWYATRNAPPLQPDSPVGHKQEVSRLFRGWHDPVPALIEATPPCDIIKCDAQDRNPLRAWGNRRATLLGDAAHPITPNVGQGACLAIEDAVCLAKCLAAGPEVAAALRSYEEMRMRRTAFIGRQSRRIGAIGQWENRWAVAGRNLAARLVLSLSPDMRLNPVYAYEI